MSAADAVPVLAGREEPLLVHTPAYSHEEVLLGQDVIDELELKPGKAKASKLLETIAERAAQAPLQQQQMSGRI